MRDKMCSVSLVPYDALLFHYTMECGHILSLFCRKVGCCCLRPSHFNGNPASFQVNTWDQGKEERSCQYTNLQLDEGKQSQKTFFIVLLSKVSLHFNIFIFEQNNVALWPVKDKILLFWLQQSNAFKNIILKGACAFSKMKYMWTYT